MAKLYWRIKKNTKWTWRAATPPEVFNWLFQGVLEEEE